MRQGIFMIFFLHFVTNYPLLFSVHSARPVDRDQDSHYVGVIIALLTTIIFLLVAAIMFIVSRNKRSPRSDVLNSLQHNFNQDTLGLGIDKRHHMKVFTNNFRRALPMPFN